MADTCGTLSKAAQTVKDHGAAEVVAIVTRKCHLGDSARIVIANKSFETDGSMFY